MADNDSREHGHLPPPAGHGDGSPGPLPHPLPGLRRLGVRLFVVSLFVLLGVTLYFGVKVFLMVFAGILFGVLLLGSGRWVSAKTGMAERRGVLLVAFALVVVVGLGGWFLVPNLSKQANQLAETLPQSLEKLESFFSRFAWGRSLLAKTPEPEQMVQQSGGLVNAVTDAFRITIAAVGNLVAILFLGLFFALSPGIYVRGFLALWPDRRKERVAEVLGAVHVALGRWLYGQLMAMAVVLVFTTAGLWMLGVELALVLGLLAGLLAFIPNIGPVISAVPAIMVGLMHSPMQALWIAILYIVIQTVESYIIYPLIQNRMVSLPPALVLSAQFLAGVTLGAFALALATPGAAAVLVIVKMLYVEDVLGKRTHLPGQED